ncbi:MAG: hypothetical protein CVV22_03400 [Ignavibacteriae bacterium HGW-Ignavibacteriae-1]|nr:MAG: hypothetical protein CVV22_03400 [Ignavibacteriae bacterium HGW-Ignavibacteriae-1]
MRIILTCFVLGLAVLTNLISQPQVAYMIPDIGAPGMNIYVEIIAPHSFKTYGNDGFHLNNPGDNVRVITANAADESKITIGPVTVSWDGRMISTQIFVSHTLSPSSYEALSLSSEFVIPLKVVVNGVESAPFNYYIVRSRPFFDGNVNQTDVVFGVGGLGPRSPRGAMIFDSLQLGGREYKVSTNDCDPNLAGNQGYLPFVLLSKGPIRGTTGTIISVNAGEEGNNLVQQGGAGGGGGGGSFCDWTGMGFRGGDGFTGGGPGGRNRSGNPVSTDAYAAAGIGSGPNLIVDNKIGGYSINAVLGGTTPAYEAAGGGTGHPFGLSGTGCNSGNNCDPDGGFGAGSGYRQNTPGGAAGYATLGQGGRGNTNGFVHGNDMVVPIAGGSGGAGGNPQCAFDCSAAGGGGGGAIRLFGSSIESIAVSANGKAGAINGCGDSQGGSGSGGHVGVHTKTNVTNVQIFATGGTNTKDGVTTTGGAGRIRYDVLVQGGLTSLPANASSFRGLVTDSSKWVTRDFTLTGFQNSNDRQGKTELYMKSESTDWTLIGEVADGFTGIWNQNVILPDPDKIFYLVAVQEIKNSSSIDYVAVPTHIMSQSAANIFLVDLNSKGIFPDEAEYTGIHCSGDTLTITFEIENDATANNNLLVTLDDTNWVSVYNGFWIDSPIGDVSIAPGNKIEVVIKYKYLSGAKTNITNRLRIPNNDPLQNPAFVDIFVSDIDEPELTTIGVNPDDFTFPETRVGQSSDIVVVLRNTGTTPLRFENFPSIGNPFSVVSTFPAPPTTIAIGDDIEVTVRFTPTSEGDFNAILNSFSIKSDISCDAENNTELFGTAVQSALDIDKYLVDFGRVPHCMIVFDTIKIQNTGTTDITFFQPTIDGADASMFTITNVVEYPITLNANENPPSGFTIALKFDPMGAATGVKTARLLLTTDDPDNNPIEITLTAEVMGFNVTAAPASIDFGNVYVGFETQRQIVMTNNADFDEFISSLSVQFPGLVAGVPNPLTISGFSDSEFTATLISETAGITNGWIKVYFDKPCIDSIEIPIRANGLLSYPTIEFDDEVVLSFPTPSTVNKVDTLEMGVFPPCIVNPIRHLKIFDYLNNSSAPYIILSENLIDATGRFFNDQSAITPPDTITPAFNQTGAQIFFDSDGAADGVYLAEFEVEIYRNGNYETYSYIIRAIVIEGEITTSPLAIDLNAFVGESENGDWTLVNQGPWNIQIMSVNFTGDPNAWSYTPDPTNFVLDAADNNTLTMSFTFTPQDEIDYPATMELVLNVGGCERIVSFDLNGSGSPSFAMSLRLPDLIADPTDDNFKVPIYARVDMVNPITDQFILESIILSFNRSLYYPVAVSNGQIVSENYIGNQRIIEIRIPIETTMLNNNVGEEFILTELTGYAMLGNEKSTILELGDIVHNYGSRVKEIATTPGSLTIEICEEGDERLLERNEPFSAVLSPNPANGFVKMTLRALEKGTHTISIRDLSGNTVHTDYINTNPGGIYELTIGVQSLPSGLYYTEISSPTQVLTLPIIITK